MSDKVELTARKKITKRNSSVLRTRRTTLRHPLDSPIDQVLNLQRTIGNQPVQRMLKAGDIQTKIKISKPNDIYEQKADRAADKVMRIKSPSLLDVDFRGNQQRVRLDSRYSPPTGERVFSMKSAPRSIQRTPAILGCTARETRNVERANQRAIAWVQNALARLSVPAAVAPYLYEHFRVMPSDTAAVESIRVEFRHVLEELQGETITYSCATTDDPSCQNPEGGQYAGYASSVGSLDAYFCDNLAQSGGEELTSTLLHESIHAMVPGMDDGPYFGESDYPGERPLANTDAYTQFAAVLAGGVHGLPRPSASAAEAAQEFDFLGSAASVGVDPSSGEGSARVFYSFAPDSEDVTEDARFYLDGMLDDMHDILDRYGGRGHFVLYAAGHSDGQTTAERSPALSRSRADNVVRYLLDRNEEDPLARRVEFSSVVVRGYADRRRAYAGSSAAARHFNRRVHVEALYVGSPGS